MKTPERVVKGEEEIVGGFRIPARDRPEEGRPLPGKSREGAEPPLRMIQGAGAAEPPEFRRENEALHFIAVRPPAIPEVPDVTSSFIAIRGEVRRAEESGDSEKDRLDVVRFFAERT
jgi:hypothetical protein